HFDFSRTHALFDALLVTILDAAESFLAVGEGDLISGLIGEAHGSLDRAVASADYEDFLVNVVVCLNEPVHDFGQLLAFNAKLARSSGLAEGEDYGRGTVLVIDSLDGVVAVGIFLQSLNLLPGTAIEVGAVQHHVPEGEQIFLRELGLVEFAIHGKFDGTGHDQFLAGVLRDGAADFVLLQGDVVQLVFYGPQGSADAGGSRAHNENVIHIGGRGRVAFSPRNGIYALPALIDGILDQRESAEFADDEEIGEGSFVFWGECGHVGSHAGGGHHHGDGPDRAGFGAQAVSDAFVTVHDGSFAGEHGEHVAFRADRGTGGAADAVIGINVGVLRPGAVGEKFPSLGCRLRLLLPLFQFLQIAAEKEHGDRRSDHQSD